MEDKVLVASPSFSAGIHGELLPISSTTLPEMLLVATCPSSSCRPPCPKPAAVDQPQDLLPLNEVSLLH
jgi:hypothetical protein